MKTRILFYTLLIEFVWNIEAIDEKCKTPLNREGFCVRTDDCPPIKAILENPQRRRNDTLLIKDSYCGTVSVNGKYVVNVCCDVNVVSNGCVLPEFPENGSYTMEGKSVKVGERVPKGTVLTYKCDNKINGIEPIPDSIYCQETREWNANVICPAVEASKEHKLKKYNTTLITIGGYTRTHEEGKFVEVFDLISQEWIEINNTYADINADKREYAAVLLNNEIIMIGGRENNIPSDTVHSYDFETKRKKSLPSLNHKKYDLSAVQFKGNVYAIGGYDDSSVPTANVEMLNSDMKQWSEVIPMGKARASFGAAVLGDEIYAVGGFVGFQKGDALEWYSNSVEAYNPSTNRWRICKPMNEKRCGVAVAVVDGYLYAVGGRKFKKYLNTGEKYDPNTNQWSAIHHIEFVSDGAAACNFKGQLVIAGGFDGNSKTDIVETYDSVSDRWLNYKSLVEHNQLDGGKNESITDVGIPRIISRLNRPRNSFNLIEIPWSVAKVILRYN